MKNSRRAFFLQGGAVLSAAAAASTGARPGTVPAGDREAILRLHLAYMASMENRRYAAVEELFADEAGRLLAESYRNQTAPVMHAAYRPNASQQEDVLAVSADRLRAEATWHVDVKLATPLQEDCTAAQMARLQGQMADCRWESGRLEGKYVRTRGEWKIASLTYSPELSRSALGSADRAAHGWHP